MLRKRQKYVHLSEHLLNTSKYTAVNGKEKSAADIWNSFIRDLPKFLNIAR
jgi:hypothetical protein